MAGTLELTDSVTTLNLLGSMSSSAAYVAHMPIRMEPPPTELALAGISLRGVTHRPRTISFDLSIKDTSIANLRTKIRDLDAMLAKAAERQNLTYGTIVVLKTQLGSTDADDIQYRVLTGEYRLPPGALDEPTLTTGKAMMRGALSLLCEPMGRLASVAVTADTLENEQDGANLNYMDITGIAGNQGGLAQIKVHDTNNGGANAWVGSKKMWIAKRSGSRRTNALFIQGEAETSYTAGTDPSSGNTLTFTGSDVVDAGYSAGNLGELEWENLTTNATLESGFLSIGRANYQIAGGSLPKGLFRVLVRGFYQRIGGSGYAVGDCGFALGWSYGALSKTPVSGDAVLSGLDQIYDLGELQIPPASTPDGFTAPTFELRIHGVVNSASTPTLNNAHRMEWRIDWIMLLPIDEGAVIVNSVGTNDRILIDGQSALLGVYILNTSDVVQKYADAVGGPFRLGPEDTRVYVLRDDTGDPSLRQFTVTPTYLPLVIGM